MNAAPYVFISYASADRERVLPLVDRLEAAGVQTWIDREGIHGGANYALEIAEAIEQAAVLVLICSEASLASRNVKQEIALAWRFEKSYLPLLLEPVEIPKDIAYWLEGSQWIELLDRAAQNWLSEIAKALQPFDIVVTPPDAQVQPRAPRERPLLVGREREQAVLREQLDRMLAGQGGTVLVGGEAGIGKTTLVEDLSIVAEEQEVLVLWGHAYDLSVTPPYGPWLEIFRQYRSLTLGLPPLPTFVFDADELTKVGSQETLFADVADFLASVAREFRLMLVLDDLHWFDQASLDFFRYLARQVASQRILLVATYRSDELHRRHPLYTLLPLLVREAGAERVEVRPLTETGHRALIQSRYHLAELDEARLERYLEEHAEGNPLYAGELLRTLEEEGILTRGREGWNLGDLEQVRVPPLLLQVIEGRVSRFDEESQRLLGVASVIGQTVPMGLWGSVGQVDEDRLFEVVERAEEAQLVSEAPDGKSVQFRHALIREALNERIPSMRRRRIHRDVGAALEYLSSPDPETVAYHYQQAGDWRAVDWLIKAGLRAETAFVLRTAAERYDAAQSLLDQDASQTERRGWLLYRLAFVKRFSAPEESLGYLDEVQTLADQIANPVLKIVAQAERGFLRHMLGNVEASLQDLQPALDAYDSVPRDAWTAGSEGAASLAVFFLPISGNNGMTADRYLDTLMETRRQSIVVSLALLGHFREALELTALHWTNWETIPAYRTSNACGGCGYAHSAIGEPERAWSMWQEAVDLSLGYHNYVVAGSTVFRQLCWVHLPYHTDDRVERMQLEADLVNQYQLAADHGNTILPPADLFGFAVQFLEGEWSKAERAATVAAATTIHPNVPALAICTLGELACHRGDVNSAWAQVRLMLPDGPSTEPGKTLFLESQILQRLAVSMALDTHDLATTRAWLEAHDRWLDWSEAVSGRAEGALLWAAVSPRQRRPTRGPCRSRAGTRPRLRSASAIGPHCCLPCPGCA